MATIETQCTARYRGQSSEGRAVLDPQRELSFSGDFEVVVPIGDVKRYAASRGELSVTFSAGELVLDLGKQAEAWALRIRYPNPLIDKLGVKPDAAVAVLGVADGEFLAQLRERSDNVSVGSAPNECDFILVLVERREDLGSVGPLQHSIKRHGSIWVVYPKGRKEIREIDVIEYGKVAGLVDVKVVSFSATHTALKMMIPVAKR
ncbi:MAG: hypothetical protein HW416_1456 [Chloroflexi bacterium]|nr:hypothetical protein [Chloroflexota bacterium]